MSTKPQEPTRYDSPQMRIVAQHPTTKEEVVVLSTKFEHSLSAVAGALGRLGITFRQEPAK